MRHSLLDRLCCPFCKGPLSLETFERGTDVATHTPNAGNGAIAVEEAVATTKEGLLLCECCRTMYPIHSNIPVMLDFSTEFHERFRREHADRLREHRDFQMPSGKPRPGELSIQETFTDEWNQVESAEDIHFLKTFDEFANLIREGWLRWIERDHAPVSSVLEVGCGLGREALALERVTGAEIVGVDLNFSLFRSGQGFDQRPNISLVISSLFNLPFQPSSFDLVFSQGVIHHTYSSRDAFVAISQFAKPGGHCFIWVYAYEDALARRGINGVLLRSMYRVESVLRPVVSRLPRALRNLFLSSVSLGVHPLLVYRAARQKRPQTLAATNHTLRDWLSPRFAHRHGYNELISWFESQGFEIVDVQSDAGFRRAMGPASGAFGVGLTGRRQDNQR